MVTIKVPFEQCRTNLLVLIESWFDSGELNMEDTHMWHEIQHIIEKANDQFEIALFMRSCSLDWEAILWFFMDAMVEK